MTVREARVNAAREALSSTGWVGERELTYLAETVVDALFPPDSLIDNTKPREDSTRGAEHR